MTGPVLPIAAEQLRTISQTQATFAHEQFIGAIAIDVDDWCDVAAQGTADLSGVEGRLPELLHSSAVRMQRHESVSPFECNHQRLAIH